MHTADPMDGARMKAEGGPNFDAEIRRQSIDPDDLLEAHVESMDACAQALLAAERMINDGRLATFVAERYAGWEDDEGRAILAGKRTLDDLARYVLDRDLEPSRRAAGRNIWSASPTTACDFGRFSALGTERRT